MVVKHGKLKYLSYIAYIGGLLVAVLHGGMWAAIGIAMMGFGNWLDSIDGEHGWSYDNIKSSFTNDDDDDDMYNETETIRNARK